MTTNTKMLYRGQAACLVLSLPPTEDNREKAKDIFAKSHFDVTYLRDSDPFSPMAIGKKTKELNPFLYLSYPPTPTITQVDTPTFSEEPLRENSVLKPLLERLLSEESISESLLYEQSTIKPSPKKPSPREPSPRKSSSKKSSSRKSSPRKSSPENTRSFRVPKVEDDENKQKLELFNKLKSTYNNESTIRDHQKNPFDGGLSDLFEMDYDVDDTLPGRIPDPVVEGDRVNIENDYEYTEGMENNSDFEVIEQPSKKKKNRKIIDKAAILNFSKKMFTKKLPETPTMYDYVFMSSIEMLETLSNYIDVGDLTPKRYQYWLTKSDSFGGPIDTYETLDGTSISGRYLYVLNDRYRKTLVRRHKTTT